MALTAEKKPRTPGLKKAFLLPWCAVIVVAGLGAAADDHLTYDKECVLCQLHLFTPAVESCDISIHAPGITGMFVVPEHVNSFLELPIAATTSRSPPHSF